MRSKKNKNFNQKTLVILRSITIIFGIVFILIIAVKEEDKNTYGHLNSPTQVSLVLKNNSILRIDVESEKWETDKVAKKIKRKTMKRINNIEKENKKLSQKIIEEEKKGRQRLVEKLKKNKKNNEYQINDLKKGIEEIEYLGSIEDYTIIYKKMNSDHYHYVVTRKEKDTSLITIQYSSIAIALHESRHFYQYITERRYGRKIDFSRGDTLGFVDENSCIYFETKAHQIHYSYDNNMIKGNSSYKDVSEWVKKRKDSICKK